MGGGGRRAEGGGWRVEGTWCHQANPTAGPKPHLTFSLVRGRANGRGRERRPCMSSSSVKPACRPRCSTSSVTDFSKFNVSAYHNISQDEKDLLSSAATASCP